MKLWKLTQPKVSVRQLRLISRSVRVMLSYQFVVSLSASGLLECCTTRQPADDGLWSTFVSRVMNSYSRSGLWRELTNWLADPAALDTLVCEVDSLEKIVADGL